MSVSAQQNILSIHTVVNKYPVCKFCLFGSFRGTSVSDKGSHSLLVLDSIAQPGIQSVESCQTVSCLWYHMHILCIANTMTSTHCRGHKVWTRSEQVSKCAQLLFRPHLVPLTLLWKRQNNWKSLISTQDYQVYVFHMWVHVSWQSCL